MTTHPAKSKRASTILAVTAALAFGAPALADTDSDTVTLRWALGAIETGDSSPSKIDKDAQLQSGDRLRFLVEPMSKGSVYLLLLDADDAIHVLYRETVSSTPGPQYIPPAPHWFKLDDTTGMETFFLLASVKPLTELDTLLDAYDGATDKQDLSERIVAEVRRQHKAHRNFARPIEKPMMIGGQTRGTDAGSIDRLAVEVTAEGFYSKTITIEH